VDLNPANTQLDQPSKTTLSKAFKDDEDLNDTRQHKSRIEIGITRTETYDASNFTIDLSYPMQDLLNKVKFIRDNIISVDGEDVEHSILLDVIKSQ